MNADDGEAEPPPAVAVSPEDQSSDREQSDADNASAVTARNEAREQAAIDQNVTSAHIDRLIAVSEKQARSNEQLALAAYAEAQSRIEMQERATLARKRFRATMVAIGVVAGLLLTGVLVLFLFVLRAIHSNDSTRDTIADCVQPTGECYQQAQRQQGEVVGGLTDNNIYTAVCAQRYADLPIKAAADAVRGCVARLTKAAAKAPPPVHTRSSSQPRSEGQPTAPTAPAPTPGATVIVQPTVTRVQHPPTRSTTVVRTVTQSVPSPTTRPNPIRSIICNLLVCPKGNP